MAAITETPVASELLVANTYVSLVGTGVVSTNLEFSLDPSVDISIIKPSDSIRYDNEG
jgi:hypothetical protein